MLSRLWYLVLAAALGIALAAAFLNKSAAGREAAFQLEEQLRRDRIEAELWLRLDARLRLDALAPLTTDSVVRQTLRSSSSRAGGAPLGARRRLSQKLNELNEKLEEGKGDILFAVDNDGKVVAGLDKQKFGNHRLEHMPLVGDALRGYLRDDVWLYNGEVLRMAARPVFDGARYVGAIVHGIQIRDGLAERLSKKLPDSSIAFFFGDELIAAHMGGPEAPSRTDLKVALGGASNRGDGGSIELGGGARAVATPIRGSAAHAGVGYLIGRRGSPIGMGALFANTYQEDVDSMPWVAVIGIPLLLGILGLLVLFLEHDQAVGILRRASERLARGEDKALPEGRLRRQYRKIALNLNTALRKGVGFTEDADERSAVDLDEILSSSRDDSSESYFGFGQEQPTKRRPSLPEHNGTTAKTERNGERLEPTRNGSVAKRPDAPPAKVTAPAPESRATSPVPGPAGSSGVDPLTDQPTSPGTLADQYPNFEFEDDSTMVADVPKELITASSGDSDEIHFREVFQQFVATQQRCGGSVAGLTFDRFVRKLRATRDQVIERHRAESVRFTVYVKEGRAALKASPVKR